MKLTAKEIETLRYTIQYRQYREPKRQYKLARLVGGPLDGIPVNLENHYKPGYTIGWVARCDSNGPLVVTYLLNERDVWKFDCYDCPYQHARV